MIINQNILIEINRRDFGEHVLLYQMYGKR